jgi:hypothetical protein
VGSTERICDFVFTEPKNMMVYGSTNTASTTRPANMRSSIRPSGTWSSV